MGWQDAPVVSAGWASAPLVDEPRETTLGEDISQTALNLLAGGVRGAGSIGATLLAPVDIAKDALAGKGLSLESNRQRRADMTAATQSAGADPSSWWYQGGKLGAELAGTMGTGGVIAKPVQALANTRAATGVEPFVDGLTRALQTSGFRAGPLAGTSAAIPARVIGGATTGGTAATLVNPEDGPTGALIGGMLPAGVAVAGRAGEAITSGIGSRALRPTQETLNTARNAMQEGYVIPPSMVKPSFGNRAVETFSGKHETAQIASTRNQEVTNNLVRRALGMPKDAPLSQEAMKLFSHQQYQAGYEPVKQLGMIPASQKFNDALDAIVKQSTGKGTIPAMGKQRQEIIDLVSAHKSQGFDSADAIDAIRALRDDAGGAFTRGEDAKGKALRAVANAYEGAIDDALATTGQRDLLTAYRDARKNIAMAHTVEKGLREGAGTVDARALGRELQKGKPLTGDLRTAASFGSTFDKAAQPPHLIGSPGVNVLKHSMALMNSGIGGAAFGPAGLALGALNYATPPVARSIMFSKPYQQGLLAQMAPLLDEASPMGLLSLAASRGAPVWIGQ